MEKQYSTHVIAAANPVYGAVNFLVLALPPGWSMAVGHLPPEVERVVKHGMVQWVASGSAVSIAINREEGKALEVRVRISGKQKRINPEGHGRIIVNGHEAFYRFGEDRVGLFRRRILDTLTLCFYCAETGRFVELKLRGLNSRGVLERVLQYLEESKCH